MSQWAGRPLIVCEKGSAGSIGSIGSMGSTGSTGSTGSMGSMGSTGVVRRIKIRSAAKYIWGDARTWYSSQQSLVSRFLNNWHLSQFPNQVRSKSTAHKIRKRRPIISHFQFLISISRPAHTFLPPLRRRLHYWKASRGRPLPSRSSMHSPRQIPKASWTASTHHCCHSRRS